MSQTKQECAEFIIVILDDMKSEVKKIMHKFNYQTYDEEFLNVDYLRESVSALESEVNILEEMFESSIPPEVKKIKHLEEENEALKNNLGVLRNQISDLEKKLAFSLTLQQ